jgi:methyltransferase (TIGR00027 family)
MQGMPSKTAMMVAAYRARASQRPDPLFVDPWADALAGAEGYALAEQMDALQPPMELWIAVRTAFIDRRIRHLVGPRCGVPQVVILGAGLDTRAARLAREGVRFFEVDHPATQAEKHRRTAALPGYPNEAAVRVPCDFERDDFLEGLTRAGFRTDAPAAIVWEGVSCYLTEAAVRATLGKIARGCAPRTSVVFDTIGTKMVRGTSKNAEDRDTSRMVDALAEPVQWGTDDPLPLLFEEGFRKVVATTFDEVALDLTGTYDRTRRWRFQHMVTASVAAPELVDEDAA